MSTNNTIIMNWWSRFQIPYCLGKQLPYKLKLLPPKNNVFTLKQKLTYFSFGQQFCYMFYHPFCLICCILKINHICYKRDIFLDRIYASKYIIKLVFLNNNSPDYFELRFVGVIAKLQIQLTINLSLNNNLHKVHYVNN